MVAAPTVSEPTSRPSTRSGYRSKTLALAVPPPDPIDIDAAVGANVKVLVLDTGLADPAFRPAFTNAPVVTAVDDTDQPDEDSDERIDPAAGHGTFIAGVIERLAPAAEVTVDRVLSTYGAGDDAEIAKIINAIPDKDLPDILNCSFSGYTEDDQPPMAITAALQRVSALGTVVVASAGNSSMCRKAWPAAQAETVSVGALGPLGPAYFTNFGPWVRACAPGVDIISRFFVPKGGDTDTLPTDGQDAHFDGWAAWSGTSFSAPIVIGALLQHRAMQPAAKQGGAGDSETRRKSLATAVARLIDDPHLCRMPGIGTIVNVQP